jgi:hypothetical protein
MPKKLVPNWKDENPFQRLNIGLLNEIPGLFATLRQPVRQIIMLVEVPHCQIFERIRSSAVP